MAEDPCSQKVETAQRMTGMRLFLGMLMYHVQPCVLQEERAQLASDIVNPVSVPLSLTLPRCCQALTLPGCDIVRMLPLVAAPPLKAHDYGASCQ